MIGLRSQVARSGSTALRGVRGGTSYVLSLGLAFVLSATLTGCGAAACSLNVVRATRSVEQAKQVGAATLAPFEMTLAQAYLEKAREESAEASYQDAVRFAKLSAVVADAAAERARGASRGVAQ